MASIKKRSDTSYLITVSCGYDKSGKKITKTKTVNLSDIPIRKRDAAVHRQAILFEDEVKKGQFVDNEKTTFEEFADKWLSDYANINLQPKTLFEYKRQLVYINKAIGHIKLIQLQPTHLNKFYNNLREDGIRSDTNKYTPKIDFADKLKNAGFTMKELKVKCNLSPWTMKNLKKQSNISPSIAKNISSSTGIGLKLLFDIKTVNLGGLSENTILHYHRLISSILNCALQWGFILYNPAERVKAPKIGKREARQFNIDETAYILDLLKREPIKYRTMITLSIYGGMREGELAALTWSDINFEGFIIRINKSLQHLPGKATFVKSTKTENTRVISVPASVMGLLKEYKKWQGEERLKLGNLWKDSDNIFTAIDGGYIYPSSVSKWFLKFLRNHNTAIVNDPKIEEKDKQNYILPEVNFHGLRHTSASLLINQGVDITTVSKRLGHAKTSTTMDIYAHSLLQADTEAANKLDILFTEKKKSKKQGL